MNRLKKWYNKLPENEKGNLQIVVGYVGLMTIFLMGILLAFGKL